MFYFIWTGWTYISWSKWSKYCLCVDVCLDVNHNYNAYTQRIVMLHAKTYYWTLSTNQNQVAPTYFAGQNSSLKKVAVNRYFLANWASQLHCVLMWTVWKFLMWDTNYTFYKIDLVRFVIDILATAVSYKSLGGLSSVPGSSAVPTDSNAATSSTSSQPPSASTGQLLVHTSSHYIAWRPHAGCGVVRIGPVCGWMWKATKPGFCTGQVFVFVFVLLVHMLFLSVVKTCAIGCMVIWNPLTASKFKVFQQFPSPLH